MGQVVLPRGSKRKEEAERRTVYQPIICLRRASCFTRTSGLVRMSARLSLDAILRIVMEPF